MAGKIGSNKKGQFLSYYLINQNKVILHRYSNNNKIIKNNLLVSVRHN